MKKYFMIVALLRVWWSMAPEKNAIFLNWIWIQQKDGTQVCYAVVQMPQGVSTVPKDDIIKIGVK